MINLAHDHHVYHKWHVFVICVYFMSYREPSVYLLGLVSSLAWAGGSLMIFPSSFIFRKSVVNRDFLH